MTFTPHDTKWIPSSARLVCCGITTSNKGILQLYQLQEGKLSTLHTNTFPNGIKCSTFGASRIIDRHLAMGDYKGQFTIVDLESLTNNDPAKTLFSAQHAHNGIINSIDGIGGMQGFGNGAPEIVTGGRDGCIRVWDPRVSTPVVSIEPYESISHHRDCWSVAFGNAHHHEERCVCAGFDNGDIKLFDLRTQSIRWEGHCKNAITSMQFDRPDISMNKLVITTLESKFRLYDLRTQHAKDGFAYMEELAHRSTVWVAKHLPQNRDIFMTGGGNGGFNIYKYHYPSNRVGRHCRDSEPVGVLGSIELLNSRILSTQPLSSFDWSPDRQGLCCMSSLDQTLR